jgi:excinuclease ABC subunit C
MEPDFDAKGFVRSLTRRPGVYRMLDAQGAILYVGKARDLRRRVGSYFSRRGPDGKTIALLQATARVEVTVTGTEQEALLLEYNLIKEHRPRFNVVLRDDKSYPYIHVTTDQPFPRFEFHRGSRKGPGRYFGPFPNAGAVRLMLQQLQKIFRVRQCTDSFFANRSRPCLQHQIHRCTAPCVGLVSTDEYGRDVENAMRFIEGRDRDVLDDLVARMEASSAGLEYERAAQYRDQIADIRRVQEQQVIAAGAAADLDAVACAEAGGHHCVAVLMIRGGRVLGSRSFHPRVARGTGPGEVLSAFLVQHYLDQAAPPEILVGGRVPEPDLLAAALGARAGRPVAIRGNVRGTRRRWVALAAENARQAAASRASASATLTAQLAELAAALGLGAPPERIECFDISHTQGGETVASCVVFGTAGAARSDYRRFNIRDVPAGDDFGALAEAVRRRYLRVRAGEAPLPDLLLVDGGRGQLARVHAVLDELGLGDVPMAAVAKGEGRRPGHERVFLQGSGRPVALRPDSPALHLIQQVRDEAHRFAITGHRTRRGRQRTTSALESVPGLGPARRRALLQQFGGLQGISRAGVADLALTPGISAALAQRIYDRFHDHAAANGS